MSRSAILSKLFIYLPAVALIGSAISWGDFYLYHIYGSVLFCFLLLIPEVLKDLVLYNFKHQKIWIFILTYATASLLWAPNFEDGLKYLGYLYCGFFLIFTIPYSINTKEKKDFIFKTMFYVFLVHLVISLLEVFTPFRWPLSQYSSLLPYFDRPLTPGYEAFAGYPTGIFWHQNNSALATLMCIPFLFQIEKKWLRYATVAASFFLILASGSKAMIVLGGGYAVFLLFKAKKLQAKSIFISVGILVAALVIAPFVLSTQQKDEISQTYETVSGYVKPLPEFLISEFTGSEFDFTRLHGNIGERFYFMAGAIELYKTAPILGAGTKAHFSRIFHKNGNEYPLKAMHNFYLELLALFGPLVLFFYVFWFLQRILKFKYCRQALVLFAIGIPVISTAAYFLPGWLLIAISEIKTGQSE